MRGEQAANLSSWVRRHAWRLSPGSCVLDVAYGDGRHARFLAGLGLHVTAVDIDLARAGKCADMPAIELHQYDLENAPWPFEDRRFDGIVVTNYLHRPLLPILAETLNPGGVLIYATFAVGNERFGRPKNPDYLLKPGELLGAFAGRLHIIAYEHGRFDSPQPAVRQRLCAKRP